MRLLVMTQRHERLDHHEIEPPNARFLSTMRNQICTTWKEDGDTRTCKDVRLVQRLKTPAGSYATLRNTTTHLNITLRIRRSPTA